VWLGGKRQDKNGGGGGKYLRRGLSYQSLVSSLLSLQSQQLADEDWMGWIVNKALDELCKWVQKMRYSQPDLHCPGPGGDCLIIEKWLLVLAGGNMA
jgi:hypothetical protein